MFGDFLKYATRGVAVAVIIGVIVGILASIHLPAIDYSAFADIIGRGYALLTHWVPGFPGIWSVFCITFGSWLIIQTARFTIYSSSIVLKIFR